MKEIMNIEDKSRRCAPPDRPREDQADPFEEGRQARINCKPLSSNPWINLSNREQWAKGWKQEDSQTKATTTNKSNK